MLEELNQLNFPKSLGSDNHSGVHPRIMEAIVKVNQGHAHSYGLDPVSELTQKEFDRVFGRKTYVYYVFNGTAANVISLSAALKPFQSVLCSEHAHLNLDECAAPEVIGRTKLIPLPSKDGKISPPQADLHLTRQGDQHHAQIKMVSLTQPTEFGVCYTLEELKAWKKWCHEHAMLLHCDGTRLANSCISTGISMAEYAQLFDFISFGGSKNGLMGAEAILCFENEYSRDLKFYRKQMLNLPSKTRFLAAQFYAYLKEDLYLEIARHVHAEAKNLQKKLSEFTEIEILFKVESNALFVKIPKNWIKPLKTEFFFYIWDARESTLRWMIGFDWTTDDTERLISHLKGVRHV